MELLPRISPQSLLLGGQHIVAVAVAVAARIAFDGVCDVCGVGGVGGVVVVVHEGCPYSRRRSVVPEVVLAAAVVLADGSRRNWSQKHLR